MANKQFASEFTIDHQIFNPFLNYHPSQPALYRSISVFLKEWYNNQDYIIVNTSGTTGPPKQIRLLKSVMLASAKRTCAYFDLTQHSNLLLCLSPEYIAGKMMIIRAIVSGANLMCSSVLNNPQKGIKGKIDFVAMVPLQLKQMIDNNTNFSNIHTILIGGTSLSDDLALKLQHIPSTVFQSYGMTETASHVALRCLNGTSKSDAYTALPGVHFGTNKQNQLIINASYISDKELVTNDLITLIDKHHFQWLGRKDTVINSGGIKFFPEQIEGKLKIHIDTAFYIHWEKDETLGQKIVLVIQSDTKLQAAELEKIFSDYLDRYEKPRKIIYQKHLQFTATGKIIRQ